MVYEISVHVLR